MIVIRPMAKSPDSIGWSPWPEICQILTERQLPLASRPGPAHRGGWEGPMKHYRVNKLTGPGGAVIKKKDVLAPNDRQAVKDAADSDDCPVCEVYRDGQKVGSIT